MANPLPDELSRCAIIYGRDGVNTDHYVESFKAMPVIFYTAINSCAIVEKLRKNYPQQDFII